MIYIIGSLKNPEVPKIAERLRKELDVEVFDDWYAAGPDADDKWRDYEQARGHNFVQALCGRAAANVFAFDRRNLDASDTVVLILPAGKSGHLELGWALGRGKKGYILLNDDPERFDVMYQFADGTFTTLEALIATLKQPLTLEPEFLEWYDVNDPTSKGQIRNPKYVPPTNQLPQVSYPDSRLFCNPAESIYCGRCADCKRDHRSLRGSWAAIMGGETPDHLGR